VLAPRSLFFKLMAYPYNIAVAAVLMIVVVLSVIALVMN
jgi:hypothetical protein